MTSTAVNIMKFLQAEEYRFERAAYDQVLSADTDNSNCWEVYWPGMSSPDRVVFDGCEKKRMQEILLDYTLNMKAVAA